VIYGWLFFSVVILLLILAGLPFREDHDGPAPLPPGSLAGPAATPRGLALAAVAVLALGLAGPAAALALQRGGSVAELPARLAAIPGCEPSADGLRCGGVAMAARLVVFPPGTTWSAVAQAGQRAFAGAEDDVAFTLARPETAIWRIPQSRGEAGMVAIGIWMDGRPAGGGLRSRVEQALRSLGVGRGRPVLAVVTQLPPAGAGGALAERGVFTQVIEAQGEGVAAEAAARSAGR
jgi:hypothetical protein